MKNYKPLPPSFVLACHPLSWRDMLLGYEIGYVDEETLVLKALENTPKSESDTLESELAFLLKNELYRAPEIVAKLANKEQSESSSVLKSKWLYLALLWTFENRMAFSEPLKVVADIYEDFGYPQEMNHFIYYMPSQGDYEPNQHSLQENLERLTQLWQSYLARKRESLGIIRENRN